MNGVQKCREFINLANSQSTNAVTNQNSTSKNDAAKNNADGCDERQRKQKVSFDYTVKCVIKELSKSVYSHISGEKQHISNELLTSLKGVEK